MNDAEQRGKVWLEKLLDLMQIAAPVEVSTMPEIDDACWLKIVPDELTTRQVETLLGTDGKTIDAMQYLANALLNMGLAPDDRQPYTLDLADYRQQRHTVLNEQVETAIAQVRSSGQEVEMPPLSAAERRQVHTMFKAFEDLETESRGSEPNRRIFVRLRVGEG
ncbi:MAG: RNA-binding protein [Spirulina sp. SIO3F2]|nr:RNA-binding protein [Spirulina sp. SIO3F2]